MTTSTPALEDYDLVVLGSGEGGKYLAWTEAKRGLKTAVIERRWVGGSCPNIACLPSKNLIHSAKVASFFRRSAEFGISKPSWTIAMKGVTDRKRAMVAGLVAMHREQYATSGAELVMGSGRFVAPKTLEVAAPDGRTRMLRGRHVVINTGSRATMDAIPGLVAAKPLTHVEALELDLLPEHLLIVGGGYIGLEFAQAMRRLGSHVTIIDRNHRLAHREDPDVSSQLQELLQAEGIRLVLDATISQVAGASGSQVTISVTEHGAPITLHGTHLLVASGRTPNTDGIGLETAGVQLTARGFVQVDARLETTAPGVWAIGDCAGNPQFTHISFDDFRVIRDNLAGGDHRITGRQVPFCLFTDPEFARIGLSETEAAAQGVAYRRVKIPMATVLRTRTLSETQGFMKALIDTTSDRILGFTMVGVGAGEVMGAVQIAMLGGLPYTALRDAVLTHPTLLEGLIPLFSSVPPRAGPQHAP